MWAPGLVLWALLATALANGVRTQGDIQQLALEKQHVGCYNDTASHDDLPHHVYTNDVINSPRECVETCRFQGYRYAGLQNSKECYCGNNDVRAFGESTSCTMTCPGDIHNTCGGALSNDVYRVSRDPRYLGCYQDDTSGTDFPLKVWGTDAAKSAHECVDACADRGFRYAAVQDGGACYCGNSYGTGGAANETDCDVRCTAWGLENCGGETQSAVYLTELAYEISKGSIDRSATKLAPIMADTFSLPPVSVVPQLSLGLSSHLKRKHQQSPQVDKRRSSQSLSRAVTVFDTQATGIPLTLYTLYPRVRTIVTKSLVLHSTMEVQTPLDDPTCADGCYTACSEITQNDEMINKGEDIHLRFFHLKLSQLKNYVGTHAQRVWVYTQTLLIDESVEFSFAVSVRTRQLFINRALASSVSTTSTKELGVDMTGRIADPEPDLMHYKQSFMCARILYDTFGHKDGMTAWSMVYDIARTKTSSAEMASFVATVRTYGAELSGMQRQDVHFVPFYTKTHLARVLTAYADKVKIYQEELEKVENAVKTKQEFIGFVKEMHLIYTTTNIAEAEKAYQASKDAITKSNATYHRFLEYYEEARINLEVAHAKFEQALNASRQNSFKKFVRDFKKGVSQIATGVVRIIIGDVPGGVGDIIGGVDTLFDCMYNLAAAMREIKQLMEMADDILQSIAVAEDHNELMKYLDDIEVMVQLEVNIVRWQNLKHYGYVILEDKEVVEIEGCGDYKRALLDFCNWGEALTRAMVESAEGYREAIEKKLLLDAKNKQSERIQKHFEDFDEDVTNAELVLWDMIEQTYDVRLDLNHALLTFCQAFFYENMKDCKASYKPTFGGSLSEVLIRINAAKHDDLLHPGGGSTLARIVEITDTDTSTTCRDATKCPINYLRNNRILFFNLTAGHPELSDIDAYKVARINLTFVGAKPTGDNKLLKVGIESSGDFQGVKEGVSYNFLTRALSLTFEYDLVTSRVTIFADVYAPYRNIVQHITPFTTWVMYVKDSSAHIDLSDVTKIKMGLDGYGTATGDYRRH